MSAPSLLLRDAELAGRRPVDLRVRRGSVTQIGAGLARLDEDVVDCAGGALLPGLHDHHVHLFAAAAAAESVACGLPQVKSRTELARALRLAAPRAGWIRAVGFDDRTVGDLDRYLLDDLRSDVAVRIQHRSGALWVVNSAGLAVLDLAGAAIDGIERDAAGRPTGRLWRLDGWLRERLGSPTKPDLGLLARRLARYGLTGVTDATPELEEDAVRLLTGGAIPQRVVLLGDRSSTAPWKIVVADHELPSLAELRSRIDAVRPRAVALHCVTRAALILAATALGEEGAVRGDRIEHAAVCPREMRAALAALRVTVVTQPSLVELRGDDYLDRVDPEDLDVLWPFASLRAAGVAVGCSSDSPYGDLDPWRTIAAARDRTTPAGRVVGPHERVSARAALTGFLTTPEAPGGAPRTISAGSPADLVLLDRPLADALREPAPDHVRLTLVGGRPVYAAGAVIV